METALARNGEIGTDSLEIVVYLLVEIHQGSKERVYGRCLFFVIELVGNDADRIRGELMALREPCRLGGWYHCAQGGGAGSWGALLDKSDPDTLNLNGPGPLKMMINKIRSTKCVPLIFRTAFLK